MRTTTAFLILSAHTAGAATVTFLVAPDTHFTSCGKVPDVAKNERGVAEMNGLPGAAYPNTSKWGGSVEANVRAVVVPGDVIDDGCDVSPANLTADPGCAAQLGNYTTRFPVGGSNASNAATSRWPTFEGVGNHDGGNSTEANGLVRRALIVRNRKRATLPDAPPKYSLSPNGLHYSWEVPAARLRPPRSPTGGRSRLPSLRGRSGRACTS